MPGNRRHLILFVAALLVVPAAARAQALSADALMNMPMEKLMNVNVEVTSASKYAQKSSEAPSAVEVITAEDIRTFGYRTLGEALNGLHGLYSSSDRNYNYLGVRGFLRPGDYNSRILVVIDGRRMNDNIYDGANTGQEFLLDMDLVDHIEFIPGPGSSIYGANAMEGVINVISKKGADINGAQVEGSAGSFATNQARATYGKTLTNGADVLLSASQYQSDGPPNLFYPEFGGAAHDEDQEISRRLFGKGVYGDWTVEGGLIDRFKQVPIASFGSIFGDPGEHTVDQMGYIETRYDKRLNDQTEVQAKVFWQQYYYDANFPYDANLTPPPVDRVVNFDAVDGRWGGFETNVVTSAFERQKVVMGLEYQYDARQRVYNYDLPPNFTLYQDHNRMGSRTGVYAQDDYKLRDNLTLSAGARLDQNHMIDGVQFNPRLAVIWDPSEDKTLKLLYGSAFRAPNVYERDLASDGNAANPNNQEERIKTVETTAEWRPAQGAKLTGSLFYNGFSQVLSQDPVTLEFVNTGNYRAYGFDLGAEKRWHSGRSVKASFEHTILHDLSSGSAVWGVDSPKNVGKVQFAQPLLGDKLKLGVEDVFVDARKTLQGSTASYYDLLNATLSSRNVLHGAEASLSVYNLFNSHPDMVGGAGAGVVNADQIVQNVIPMNGRSVMAKLQYTF
jgi:outer membrane receptor for ferrienterochelin and colicins